MIRGNQVSLTPQAGDVSDRVATTQFVNTQSANFLTTNGNQTLVGGFGETPFNLGTLSATTITPSPLNNLKQCLVNAGTFTVSAPTVVGDLELYVTNTATAGTINFTSFTKQWPGDSLDTTNGHEFAIFIYCFRNALGTTTSAYLVKAMQ